MYKSLYKMYMEVRSYMVAETFQLFVLMIFSHPYGPIGRRNSRRSSKWWCRETLWWVNKKNSVERCSGIWTKRITQNASSSCSAKSFHCYSSSVFNPVDQVGSYDAGDKIGWWYLWWHKNSDRLSCHQHAQIVIQLASCTDLIPSVKT